MSPFQVMSYTTELGLLIRLFTFHCHLGLR